MSFLCPNCKREFRNESGLLRHRGYYAAKGKDCADPEELEKIRTKRRRRGESPSPSPPRNSPGAGECSPVAKDDEDNDGNSYLARLDGIMPLTSPQSQVSANQSYVNAENSFVNGNATTGTGASIFTSGGSFCLPDTPKSGAKYTPQKPYASNFTVDSNTKHFCNGPKKVQPVDNSTPIKDKRLFENLDEIFAKLSGNVAHSEEEDDNDSKSSSTSYVSSTAEAKKGVPDTSMMEEFRAYVEYAKENFCDLSPEMKAGIELMSLMNHKRVPLNTYKAIYQWHLGNLRATTYIGQETCLNSLEKRYNATKQAPHETEILTLPHSKARVKLATYGAKDVIASILTDPRIEDDDYLFYDNNPFGRPPPEVTTVGDLHTGLA